MIRLGFLLLNSERRCPTCNGHTERVHLPRVLRFLRTLLGDGVTYRSCRNCKRRWIALGSAAESRPERRKRKNRGSDEE